MPEESEKRITVGEMIADQKWLESYSPEVTRLKEMFSKNMDVVRRAAEVISPMIASYRPIIESTERFRAQLDAFRDIASYQPFESSTFLIPAPHKRRDYARSETDICIIYSPTNGQLTRTMGGRDFSYDLLEDGKRKRMIEALLERDAYIKTRELAEILGCPSSQAVAKVAQTLNDQAKSKLRLKGVKIIVGKKGSGYRINPKIHIEED